MCSKRKLPSSVTVTTEHSHSAYGLGLYVACTNGDVDWHSSIEIKVASSAIDQLFKFVLAVIH